MQINWEEQLGSETDHCNPGFQGQENKVSEPLAVEIVGVPEEEQQQEIENLFEQIMKENFPSLENLKSSKRTGESYLQRSSHKPIS